MITAKEAKAMSLDASKEFFRRFDMDELNKIQDLIKERAANRQVYVLLENPSPYVLSQLVLNGYEVRITGEGYLIKWEK